MAKTIIAHICFWAFTACLLPASGFAGENSELVKLDDSVYARIASPDGDAVGNAGAVILDESVLVFDTHFTPEAGAAFLAAIRKITPKPVRYVVNSHWHADHTHGNQAFQNAYLIGSANTRRDILEIDLPSLNRTVKIAQSQLQKIRQEMGKGTDPAQMGSLREQVRAREAYLQTMSQLQVIAPSLILEDGLTIEDGKQKVRLLFLGAGHTDGDIILFLPAQKIIFAGDLFFNKAIPNVQDANILEWVKTLEALLKLSADRYVPGHGSVGTRKDVEEFRNYFEELKNLVQPAVDRGDTLEQAMQEIQMPAKYSAYQFQNFFPSNIQKMYAELKALQQETKPPQELSGPDPKDPVKQK